jgi:hypothetical protein
MNGVEENNIIVYINRNRTAITRDNLFEVISAQEQNHSLSQNRGTGIEVFRRIKRQALEHPEMAPSQVIRNRLQSVPSRVLPHLPDRAALKRILSGQRQAELPTNTQNNTELEDIPNYTKSHP